MRSHSLPFRASTSSNAVAGRRGQGPLVGSRGTAALPARGIATQALSDAVGGLYQNVRDQAGSTLGSLVSQLPPLPEPLNGVASTSRDMLQGVESHWGSRQVAKAIETFTQQPMAATQQAAQNAAAFSEQLRGSASALPSGPQELIAAAADAAAAASALPGSLSAAASELQTSASSLLAAAVGSETGKLDLDSHFGTHFVQQTGTVLADWLATLVSKVSDGSLINIADAGFGSLGDANSMLGELQQLGRLLATLPSMPGGSLSPGIEAGQAALGSLLQQQQVAAAGAAAAAAASGSSTIALSLQKLAGGLAALQTAATAGFGGHSPAVLAVTTLATLATIAATMPGSKYEGYTSRMFTSSMQAKLGHVYDAPTLSEYFEKRPLAVAQRAAVVAAEAAGFGVALLLDIWTGKVQANEAQRARQLRGIIERLGPAYVKVAQAISTRVDLLTPEYFTQIQLLQDRVPPFPCDQARAAMAEAFGRPIDEVFDSLSERPVAAASLGQVYRAKLRTEMGGGDVAVKVLRPGVLEQVALDLYLMRELAAAINRSGSMNTDWVAVIDEWALRFFAEMDYELEARNAVQLGHDMSRLSGITVAQVVPELSTADVLTTEWVDGEKLSESRADDVRTLCNTLLNAYLIQLLETGFLHADPHPGNLLRTPDGKICILDYGLMTYVTEEQRWALLEYIAHLSTEDWPALAHDLQVMGFIPKEIDPTEAGLVEPLGKIMVQLVGGGGAAKVNIDKVTDELTQLGKRYPFSIPPFFALILRAFSVIEGIALKVDPDYAIVKECFPYLSRRLLQDDTGRANNILRDILYGNKQRLDMERLTRLANGFSAFTTDGLQEEGQGQISAPSSSSAVATAASGSAAARSSAVASSSSEALDPVLKDALIVMLGKRGSYVQDLLVAEAVAAADALSSASLYALLQALLGSTPAALARSTVAALGPLRQVLLPLPTPLEVLSRLSPALATTPEDREALGVVQGILTLLQATNKGAVSATAAAVGSSRAGGGLALRRAGMQLSGAARDVAPLLPELAPGLTYMAESFTRAFVQRLLQRLTSTGPLGMPLPGAGEAARGPGAGVSTDGRRMAPAYGFMPMGERQGRRQGRAPGNTKSGMSGR